MAYKTKNFTLNGNVQSLANLDANNNPIHTPIKSLRLMTATGVADVKVGDRNLSATVYADIVDDGPAQAKQIFGPFGGGECPANLEDFYVLGTNNEILHVAYVTL